MSVKFLLIQIKKIVAIQLGIFFILQALSLSVSAKAAKCESVLDGTPIVFELNSLVDLRAIHFSEDPIFSEPISSKSKYYKEALAKLLQFYANTVNENANEKISLEKGEMHLGYKLNNGSSFEFHYVVDKRFERPRFVLDKITYYKKNMQEQEILDAPLDEDLEHLTINSIVLSKMKDVSEAHYSALKKSDISEILSEKSSEVDESILTSEGKFLSDSDLKSTFMKSSTGGTEIDWISLMPSIEIKIPLVISGEILDIFIKKSELYQDLDRQVIRNSLQNGSLRKLDRLGYQSFFSNKVKKVFIRQSVKGLIWQVPFFTLIYLLNPLHDIEKGISNLDDTEPVYVSQDAADLLINVFNRADTTHEWHNTKLYKKLIHDVKLNLSQNVLSLVESTERLVNWYVSKEKHKSEINFVRSNENFTLFTKVSSSNFINKENPSATTEHLIFNFPHQETLVIVTRSYSKLDLKQLTFESHVVVNSKKNPSLYLGLIKMMSASLGTMTSDADDKD